MDGKHTALAVRLVLDGYLAVVREPAVDEGDGERPS
jgi:hypothetical protein